MFALCFQRLVLNELLYKSCTENETVVSHCTLFFTRKQKTLCVYIKEQNSMLKRYTVKSIYSLV